MIKEFCIKSRVYSGDNALSILKQYSGYRIGIVTDSFMIKSGLIDKITEPLAQNQVLIFSDVKPDPDIDVLKQGARFFYDFNPQIMIAFGGGSSLDAAKGIVATLNSLKLDHTVILIAIPTTSGSGSEVTSYAVISDPINSIKYPLVSDDLLADIAILDSSLVMSLPKGISMDTGMDVMTHAIEAYVSINANDFSDAFAEKAIGLVYEYLPQIYQDLNNHKAREKLHNASCMAGMAFNSAGLGLVHGMAHALGALLHIPHGKMNAMLLPIVIQFNGQNNDKAVKRYARCAQIMGFSAHNPVFSFRQLVNEIKAINKKFGIPTTLKVLGADLKLLESQQEQVIDAVLNDSCTKTNPKPVNRSDIKLLLAEISG